MNIAARAALALPLAVACAPQLGNPFVEQENNLCGTIYDGGPPCSVSPDFEFHLAVPDGRVRAAADGTRLASLPICMTGHEVDIQLYPGRGVFAAGPVAPGTYELTGDELAMDTCGACVRLFEDIDALGVPTRTYMATGGFLHLQRVGAPGGEAFSARLGNVPFREVTIDPLTFATAPIGTCATRISSIEVQAPVSPLR